ncbi:hypothetical protein M4D79_23240 [Mycolicibacterium novocastrense]|nr:hypothetical protein M4D79_23240 [Mycolicibacterium novocastrense]
MSAPGCPRHRYCAFPVDEAGLCSTCHATTIAPRDSARQGVLDTDMAEKLADAVVTTGLDGGDIESTISSAVCAEEVGIEAPPLVHQPPIVPAVDGAEVLTNVLDTLCRYVRFPDKYSAVAAALWVAATHAIEAWNAAPRLVLNARKEVRQDPRSRRDHRSVSRTPGYGKRLGISHLPIAWRRAPAHADHRRG